MVGQVSFALLREGTSDDGLVAVLRQLLVVEGAARVIGAARPYRGSVYEKITELLTEEQRVDLIFVHRDSDTRDARPRLDEIRDAATQLGVGGMTVGIVPVTMTEAWLLCDEQAIRDVVGRSRGTEPLGLPGIGEIERLADPKAALREACLRASNASGRRRQEVGRAFTRHRASLLERLNVSGPVSRLSAWGLLRADIREALAGLDPGTH